LPNANSTEVSVVIIIVVNGEVYRVERLIKGIGSYSF
jgi:hypothetical protein